MEEQNKITQNLLQGKLLIAHPRLPRRDWFWHSVIYVYEHSEIFGSTGLVLNLPSKISLQTLCLDWNIDFPCPEEKVYLGGPITPSSIMMLHSSEWSSINTASAGNSLSVTSDYGMFDRLAGNDNPVYWRIFAGIATWAPGQLESELAAEWPYKIEHSWLLADPNEEVMFENDQDIQWQSAVDLAASQFFDTWI